MKRDEINKRLKHVRKLIQKHSKTEQELLSQCEHEVLIPEHYYFEGGYLDKAYTEYWDRCDLCGMKFNKRKEQHSWYG